MMNERRMVLVVDDDEDICTMVGLSLQSAGYRVATAREGGEALTRVAEEMPGAIVLDMKMPGMNGWDFAREFRGRYGKHTPIMVLTAARAASERAAEIDAEGFLDKPFDIDQLLAAVERLLRWPSGAARPVTTPEAAAEEAAMLQRAIAGDASAFGWLYEKYAKGIHRYLAARLKNPQDAEDLTQQVFVQAWAKIGSYRPSGPPFSAWLLVIAHNALVSFYRRQRYSSSLDDPVSRARVADVQAERDPMEVVERQLQYDAVRDALSALPSLYRRILLLRFVRELPHREVAAALSRSEGAVRILQVRALRKLQQALSQAKRL